MIKILMGEDSSSIARCEQSIERILPRLKDLNETFKQLGSEFKNGLAQAEIKQSVMNETFLADKIIGDVENPTIGGIKVSLTKLREIIELPEGAEVFSKKAKDIKASLMLFHESGNLNFFTVKNTEVVVNKEYFNQYIEEFKYYATTQKQKHAWERLNVTTEGLNLMAEIQREFINSGFELRNAELVEYSNYKYKPSLKGAQAISKLV